MDPRFNSNYTNGFKSNQIPNTLAVEDQTFGFIDNPFLHPPHDPNNASISISTITEEDSPLDETDFSATVLRYINQMLMEEDMEKKPCMFHDSLALQAAEKSFYEVIGQTYPSVSSIQNHHNVDSPDSLGSNFSSYSNCGTTTSSSNSVEFESYWSNFDVSEYKPSILQTVFPTDFVFQASSMNGYGGTTTSSSNFGVTNGGFLVSSRDGFPDSNLFSKNESVLQFERGVEEANKFLPKVNPLVIDLENNHPFIPSFRKVPQEIVVKTESSEREHFSVESRGRKNHERGDETDLQDERSNKQSAVYTDDSELSELFDKVLLGTGCRKEGNPKEEKPNEQVTGVQQKEEANNSGGGKGRGKKQGNKKGVVDLRTMLILCAQSVSSDDHATAKELLKQIRQHSSPLGDGSQRLAHCFANALEARLAGTGTQIYTALYSKRNSAADMVKAYQIWQLHAARLEGPNSVCFILLGACIGLDNASQGV
ncbi:hypothetical protein TSUD_87690 [Trifolium subterraneum]|uniref:Uncharacterized protein n=1 Tax=Trifolium subterraneum TaxID=3900 RepID=A0A2Z6NYJ1_TRISU|nr:hypothetical protein TSUD_87690 [Trifolium subterraneum]